ncbi:MAG TPA: DUF1611 domain-containing protein [Planctomycetes bacterium]|nr:DUF1611 domain-containing protein [Planctomycetota bacterium]
MTCSTPWDGWPAVVLTGEHFETVFAKTAHGLVRGPSRFPVMGVVDRLAAGKDAGEILDGHFRNIPVRESLDAFRGLHSPEPRMCIVGVATAGGRLPDDLRQVLIQAARRGMVLVNGLHEFLRTDEEIREAADVGGAVIVDLRSPKPFHELSFWTGEVLKLDIPRVAVLGTDCALGKRTTMMLLAKALEDAGTTVGKVSTGQTGFLQGVEYGFILDATPNDFVSGELERAILGAARALNPDLILIEGQSSLHNPSGPCGAEFILSGGVTHVILQHAPHRTFFEGFEEEGFAIPPIEKEIRLIEMLGARVHALTLNEEGLDDVEAARRKLAEETGRPVFRPLAGECDELAQFITEAIRT